MSESIREFNQDAGFFSKPRCAGGTRKATKTRKATLVMKI